MDYREAESGAVQETGQLEHTGLRVNPAPARRQSRGSRRGPVGDGGDTRTPRPRAGAMLQPGKRDGPQLLRPTRTMPLGTIRMLENAIFGKKTSPFKLPF